MHHTRPDQDPSLQQNHFLQQNHCQKPNQTKKLDQLFAQLWQTYAALNPQVEQIRQHFIARGDHPINDHIALRTLDHPACGLAQLVDLWQPFGYAVAGHYQFVDKKLIALHLQHADLHLPKIFISALQYQHFSTEVQQALTRSVAAIPNTLLGDSALLYSGRHWPIDWDTYQLLAAQSEYAAWFYVYGFTANHFTINVNQLTTFLSLQQVNQFMIDTGYALNTVGGVIKGSPETYLEQSATLAEPCLVKFDNLTSPQKIPGVFFEFAKRYADATGQLFQGFVTQNADKIFESTHRQINLNLR